MNIQSRQSIINTIVHSEFRLTSAFATFFDACLVTFVHILPTFPSPFLGRSLKQRKSIRSSANLKSFLNGRFTFLTYLKNCCFFLSHTHTHTHKFCFQLRDTSFHCISPFSGFPFQSNPHSEDPFLILGNKKVPQLILYMDC